VKLAALGATGLALDLSLGCNTQATEVTGSQSSKTALAQGAKSSPTAIQPVRGGTLTWLVAYDIIPAAVPYVVTGQIYSLLGTVYETLLHYRTDRLEARPELAESWSFSPDNLTLTIKLRTGVKFHTGREFTSADVKWNLQTASDSKLAASGLNMIKWIQKIETPDARTVVLTFDQPRSNVLDMFEYVYMADPETFTDGINGKRFVGTGPFLYKEWVPGDHLTVTRNPDYWRADQPYLDEVTFKVIPEPQTQLIQLQSGGADMASNIDPRDAKDLEKDNKYTVFRAEGNAYDWYLGIDVSKAPFNDKRVRQAMSLLLDRKRMVDTELIYGQPLTLPWDKTSPAYIAEQASRESYNPTKAKDLLAQAGLASGAAVSIQVSQGVAHSPAMAEILQAELAKLGWKASVDKIPSAEFADKNAKGTYGGLWIAQVAYVHLSPASLFVMAKPFRLPNSANFESPAYAKLIDDLSKPADEATMKKLYQQMNDLLLDECFVNPIATTESPWVGTSKVKGVQATRGQWALAGYLWKSK
jgi:peptide/nickel transport system substrate-binding protein